VTVGGGLVAIHRGVAGWCGQWNVAAVGDGVCGAEGRGNGRGAWFNDGGEDGDCDDRCLVGDDGRGGGCTESLRDGLCRGNGLCRGLLDA